MLKLLGKKVKMTQVWQNDKVVPVSVVKMETDEGLETLRQAQGKRVKVTGVTKGRGFQGVVKRHGFGGGPQTHGQKNRLRAPGSIGSTAPQRVHPGRKMAGRMGGDQKTIKNILVMEIKTEGREVFLKGALPGSYGSRVEIYL